MDPARVERGGDERPGVDGTVPTGMTAEGVGRTSLRTRPDTVWHITRHFRVAHAITRPRGGVEGIVPGRRLLLKDRPTSGV